MKTTQIFTETAEAYSKGFDIIANKGGSRSSKTFSELQLLYTIMNRSKRKRVITVVSHSFPHLEGGAIRDFDKILEGEGINPDSIRTKKPHVYKIGRSLLEFVGFDNAFHKRFNVRCAPCAGCHQSKLSIFQSLCG